MKKNKSEYRDILLEYSFSQNSLFSTIVPNSKWKQGKEAETFLEKYWLSSKEFIEQWQSIQNHIFVNRERGLPDLRFSKNYEMIALRGGILFEEKDFLQLQKCMEHVGDKHFVVIQNDFGGNVKPILRMKFPTNISWKELMSGGVISIALVEYDMNEYFVFGESGAWGKYSANDYRNPVDIIGFEKKYATFFRETFKVSEKEQKKIAEWVPPGYLDTPIK